MLKNVATNDFCVDLFIQNIQKRFNCSDQEMAEIIEESQITLPITIFSDKLGMLESACFYLKDKQKLSFTEIAKLLKRDYKTIWTSYSKSKKKQTGEPVSQSDIVLPVIIFCEKLGVLESACVYLKDELGLSFANISKLLKRDYKTIWASYDKGKKKLKKNG